MESLAPKGDAVTDPLVVIGGSEHARVVIEAARSCGNRWEIEGFVDPRPCEATQQRLGVRWLGDDHLREDAIYVLGVGAVGVSDVRPNIIQRYAGARFAAIVHERAWVSSTASIADGAVVLAGAIVQSGAQVGAHAVVGAGTIVEHDVTLGAFVQTGPGVVIGGGVAVGDGSYLGLGARIRDHITIGKRAMIAMGAVVTANVGGGAVMLGIPARAK